MNGKRWPWEAVTLLPFINAKKLVEASQSLVDTSKLSDEEKKLNEFGETHVLTRSSGTVEMEPLKPFEQLLACLPPSSSYLLPEPYRWLMTSPDSPLIE